MWPMNLGSSINIGGICPRQHLRPKEGIGERDLSGSWLVARDGRQVVPADASCLPAGGGGAATLISSVHPSRGVGEPLQRRGTGTALLPVMSSCRGCLRQHLPTLRNAARLPEIEGRRGAARSLSNFLDLDLHLQ